MRRANPVASDRAACRTGPIARSARDASPATGRPSSIAVQASRCSAAAAAHSSGVRTACPTVNPASHSGYRSASTASATDPSSSWTISRSMSDAGSCARHPVNVAHPELPVADLPRARGLHERIDDPVDVVVLHYDLDLHLRDEVHLVLGPAIDLGVSALTAEALHVGRRETADADLAERF